MKLIKNYGYKSEEEGIELGDYISFNFNNSSYDKDLYSSGDIIFFPDALNPYPEYWIKLSYEIISKL